MTTLRHDVDALRRRITPAERWATEAMVGVFTNGFIVAHFGSKTAHLLPAEDAYAAWQAVWRKYCGAEPQPLSYELFAMAMQDRGYSIVRWCGTDFVFARQLHISSLVAEMGGDITPELHTRLRAAADELYAVRGEITV